MNQDPELKSRFENDILQNSDGVDFDTATRLERSGSTCDAYIARYRRRRVFVKRLKEEYRYNAVYRAAFEKEYELGAGLKHKSLPEYREAHDDYIIMDFVDGVTLADIIKAATNGDRRYSVIVNWLKKPKNIRRVLLELMEVADYLHRHNIVHCDIKPDNVMLAEGSNNVILLDLDKAYTGWLDDTAGSPEIYGLGKGKRGSVEIDCRGIGAIVDMLGQAGFPTGRFRRFRNKCFSENIDYDRLLRSLKNSGRHRPLYATGIASAVIAGAAIISSLQTGEKDKTAAIRYLPEDGVAQKSGAVYIDTVPARNSDPEGEPTLPALSIKGDEKSLNLDRELDRIFKELTDHAYELDRISSSENAGPDELWNSMNDFYDKEAAGLSEAYKAVQAINEERDIAEAMKTVYHTRQYLDYMKVEDSVLKVAGARYKMLLQGEEKRN